MTLAEVRVHSELLRGTHVAQSSKGPVPQPEILTEVLRILCIVRVPVMRIVIGDPCAAWEELQKDQVQKPMLHTTMVQHILRHTSICICTEGQRVWLHQHRSSHSRDTSLHCGI